MALRDKDKPRMTGGKDEFGDRWRRAGQSFVTGRDKREGGGSLISSYKDRERKKKKKVEGTPQLGRKGGSKQKKEIWLGPTERRVRGGEIFS